MSDYCMTVGVVYISPGIVEVMLHFLTVWCKSSMN